MKSKQKKILSLFLAAVMVIFTLPFSAVTSFALTSGDFSYSVVSEEEQTCKVTGYSGASKEITIPSQLDGYTVIGIGYAAFKIHTSIKSIEIPDSVEFIDKQAFYQCDSLEKIIIPNSVKSIGAEAFLNCGSLKSIEIPDSVKSIGENAFKGTAYYTTESNWENNALYINNHLIRGKEPFSIEYSINSGTKTIGDGAFSDLGGLEKVEFPNSVTVIGNNAFEYCEKLGNLEIPDSVTSIGSYAFRGCSSLMNIKISNSVSHISSFAFRACTNLKRVEIPSSVTDIDEYAFYDCRALTDITIPNSVKCIGILAFMNCDALKNIEIPESVTDIGDGAFASCSMLENITVVPGNESFCDINGVLYSKDLTRLAHCGASQSGSYTIPDSVKEIDYWAFGDCTLLTNIKIPYGVMCIGGCAFRNCKSLRNIEIPDSVSSMGNNAFDGCTSLERVKLSNGLSSIGSYTFRDCSSLTSVNIPYGTERIISAAFVGCASLKSIMLSEKIKFLAHNAFIDCDSLTIYGYKNSYVDDYTRKYDLPFAMFGDVDGDGIINSNDYAMIKSNILCSGSLTEEQLTAADYNKDGAVDAFDVIAIDVYLHS